MEKIKHSVHSLKRSFMTAVGITVLILFLCSAATIYGCYRIQEFLLPDSDSVWVQKIITYADGTASESGQIIHMGDLFEFVDLVTSDQEQELNQESVKYTVDKIEASFDTLSPKRKLLYQGISVSMIVLPLIYSVIGIMICSWWFYRKKIAPPVQIVSYATEKIRAQDLDFEVNAVSQDELGQLCQAFEEMRQTLCQNNRQLWSMIENRRILQASVAHDLRNPIAIIEGYVEYMQENSSNGRLSVEKLEHTLSNLAVTAKRLERYTDCMQELHALEETEIRYVDAVPSDDLNSIVDGFRVMAEGQGKLIISEIPGNSGTVRYDKAIVARILENVFANALRYAQEEIRFRAFSDRNRITVFITDDGPGFSERMLKKKSALLYSEDKVGGHMGLGLATSRILCQKHGGEIELSNVAPHGACVKIVIAVRPASIAVTK